MTDPKLVLVFDATASKASTTVVKATCPALGTGIVWFAPTNSKPVASTYEAVFAAYESFEKGL